MTAVVEAAQTEADQLKTDLKTRQAVLVDEAQEETAATAVQATGAAGVYCTSAPVLTTRAPDGGPGRPRSASARPGESTATAGDLPDPPDLIATPRVWGRGEEEEDDDDDDRQADVTTAGPHVRQGEEAASSPSAAARLAEAQERTASAEKSLLEAKNSSAAAVEQAELLERQLELARAAAGSESEEKRRAQARIAELERNIDLMGQEQEAIRERAESRLESLRAAFEQEELEAGGKVCSTQCNTHERRVELGRVWCCVMYPRVLGQVIKRAAQAVWKRSRGR